MNPSQCKLCSRRLGVQDWRDANTSQTSIPFGREYTLSDDPATAILKQNIGMFTLRGGAEVHIQSFGIFNLTLWDDVMAQFEPLTPQDIVYVGETGRAGAAFTP